MDPFDIVREETRRMTRGCVGLALLTYAVFLLLGYRHPSVALSLALGTAYTLYNFHQMAFSAVRAALMDDPAEARRIQTIRYLMRYMLTAVLLIGAIKLPFFHAVAVTLPLFFPRIIIFASGIVQKKGG